MQAIAMAEHLPDQHSDPKIWTGVQIRAQTTYLLSKNEDEAIKELVLSLGNTNGTQHCIDALFENDRADIVVPLVKHPQTKMVDWVNNHFVFMMEHCPKLYQEWENGDYGHTLLMLTDTFGGLSVEECEAILKGSGRNNCEQRFRELLALAPGLWEQLPPTWVGASGSALREAAIALGWKSTMLVQMFNNDTLPDALHCTMFAYPFSVFAVLNIVQEPDEEYPYVVRDFDDDGEVRCPKEANVRDIALANALMVQAQSIVGGPLGTQYRFSTWDGEPVEPTDEMMAMVNIYSTLNCLDTLVESLVGGVLPGIDLAPCADDFALPHDLSMGPP